MQQYNLQDDLQTTSALVKYFLEHDEQARCSDNYLNYLVLKRLGEQKGIDIDNTPILQYLLHLSKWGFPTFETIRRARQRIQAENPELSANGVVKDYRRKNELIYRAYAKRSERDGEAGKAGKENSKEG